MGNSVFTGRLFTNRSSDFICTCGGFRSGPGRHSHGHECPQGMTSGVPSLAEVVCWSFPFMLFGWRIAQLETFTKALDWFWLSAHPSVSGSLTPVPAYASLPHLTYNPYHKKEYQ